MTVSFFAPGVAAPKGSMRAIPFRAGRRLRVSVKHDNPRTKSWSTTVAWAARAALKGGSFGAAPVMVRLEFVLPRPASHYRAGGELKPGAPAWPTSKQDVDKLTRCVFDALTGIAWTDDGQVVRAHVAKHFQDPSSDWRAAVGCRVEIVALHDPSKETAHARE